MRTTARRPSGPARSGRPRTAFRLWSAVGLTLAGVAAVSTTAQAHTDLLSSSPKAGAVLQNSPDELTLTFSEDIDPDFATVVLTVGDARERLDTDVVRGEVTGTVPRSLDAGTATGDFTWSVAYRVVSADGHPVSGKVDFEAPFPKPPAASGGDGTPAEEPGSTTADPEDAEVTEDADDAVVVQADQSEDSPALVWAIVLGAGLILAVPAMAWGFRRRSDD